ncbi:MAG: endonuclease III [Myxococcota bacterium]
MQQRAERILDLLVARFPNARIELDYNHADPWQLLVVVCLSAQTTDVRVNQVSPALFAAYPTVHAMAAAQPQQVEPYIRSLGFFRAKADNLVRAARAIVEQFGGRVPQGRAELETLPGVGPKGAAVIVANAFGRQAIAVDTHVGRVARRLGLTKQRDPSRVESELTALLPKQRLLQAHHTLIWHGRRICHARKQPECHQCPVATLCPRVGV